LARVYYHGIKPLVATRKLIAGGVIFEEQTEESEVALFKGSVVIYSGNVLKKAAPSSRKMFTPLVIWNLSKAQILPVSRDSHFNKEMITNLVCSCRSRAASVTNIDAQKSNYIYSKKARTKFKKLTCTIQ
jgi:hypothetical protein